MSGTVTIGQDGTNFNGAGGNGTFIFGSGHGAGDIIGFQNGTTLQVTVAGGPYVNPEFEIIIAGSIISAGDTLYQESTTGFGTGFVLNPGTANLTPLTNNIQPGDINDVFQQDDINDYIGNPAENTVVWHSGNLPSFANPADFGSPTIGNASLTGGDISASQLAGEIAAVATEATRIRRTTVSKSSSGTNPGLGGCVFGSNGTRIAALSSAYQDAGAIQNQAQLAANFSLQLNTDASRANLVAAINAEEALLSTHRNNTPPINLVSCHCSCHSNCHSNRSRR